MPRRFQESNLLTVLRDLHTKFSDGLTELQIGFITSKSKFQIRLVQFFQAVFRIHDSFVRIRIPEHATRLRIRIWIRNLIQIMLFLCFSRCQQKRFLNVFFAYYFKDNKSFLRSHKNIEIKVFLNSLLGDGRIRICKNNYGSGSCRPKNIPMAPEHRFQY
jgi:hypothetical protein